MLLISGFDNYVEMASRWIKCQRNLIASLAPTWPNQQGDFLSFLRFKMGKWAIKVAPSPKAFSANYLSIGTRSSFRSCRSSKAGFPGVEIKAKGVESFSFSDFLQKGIELDRDRGTDAASKKRDRVISDLWSRSEILIKKGISNWRI